MVKIYKLLLVFLIVMQSCYHSEVIPFTHSNGEFIIVDSNGIKTDLLLYPNDLREGYFPIYYIGKVTDTIRLGKSTIFSRKTGDIDYSKSIAYESLDSTKMRIVVDTSLSLSHAIDYLHFDEEQKEAIVDSTKIYKAFPIYIYNTCDSTIPVGHRAELGRTIRQVKNEQGKWVDLEGSISYGCLFNSRLLLIEPGEIAVAKLPRHQGDFEVLCRLKFTYFKGQIYSNTFTDFIEKRQLKNIQLSEQ